MKLKNITDLIAVLTLQKANLGTYLTQVSCTAADVTAVTNILNNVNATVTYCEQLKGAVDEAFENKDLLVYGDLGVTVPVFVPLPTPIVLTSAISGALKYMRALARRQKAGPGYTDPIGDALGIGPSDPTAGSLPTPPTFDLKAAQSGYVFSIVVSNRQESDRWEPFVRPVGSTGARISMGSRTTKSSDFTFVPPPVAAGDEPAPVQLEVLIQLMKSDANYADPSDIKLVTVNP